MAEVAPDNFFVADRNLQRLLEFYWGQDGYHEHLPRLYDFGRLSATIVDLAARLSNDVENLPRLHNYDGLGNRLAQVDYHPAYHEAGRAIYNSGVISVYAEPGNNLLSLALFYLSSLNGEAGHNCPVAMSAGMVKLLQAEARLPCRSVSCPPASIRITTGTIRPPVPHGGAGRSDVGANATIATPWTRRRRAPGC